MVVPPPYVIICVLVELSVVVWCVHLLHAVVHTILGAGWSLNNTIQQMESNPMLTSIGGFNADSWF